jgi:soluble lytic murein transglycosylase-like protein
MPDRSSVSVGYARQKRPARHSGRRDPAVSRATGVDPLIHAVGRNYRIDPRLLAAMVRAESAGRPGAISHKGALGLMQVMPGTARSLGVREPRALLRDPALALSTGALYLKTLQAKFGNNLPLVVAAYNAGPGAVTRAGMRVPAYRETQGYVSTVMGRYGRSRGR